MFHLEMYSLFNNIREEESNNRGCDIEVKFLKLAGRCFS